jgi:hypothetical protein
MAGPDPNVTIDKLTLTPADADKLTSAAKKITYKDLLSIEAAFKDMDTRPANQPLPDLGCCCCCCSAAAQLA